MCIHRLLKSHIHKSLNSIFVCTNCEQVVARRCDIFSVPGADGMVGAYVNPHGCVVYICLMLYCCIYMHIMCYCDL